MVAGSNENMVSGQCRLGAMMKRNSWPPPRSTTSPPFTARDLNGFCTRFCKNAMQTLLPTTVAFGANSRMGPMSPEWSGSVCEQTM